MPEYIKRSGALKALETMESIEDGLTAINDIPAADVVEVVRCRECRYWIPIYRTSGDCLVRIKMDRSVRVGDFCSYWERRDGDG